MQPVSNEDLAHSVCLPKLQRANHPDKRHLLYKLELPLDLTGALQSQQLKMPLKSTQGFQDETYNVMIRIRNRHR